MYKKDKKLDNEKYYITYDGHLPEHIQYIRNKYLEKGKNKFVYLTGESLFDNKRYIKTKSDTIYKNIFEKEYVLNDIENQLNVKLLYDYVCLNCSYSDSSLTDRNKRIYENDNFVRDNISTDDMLLIGLNGSDFFERTNQDLVSKISYTLEHPVEENKSLLFICEYIHDNLKKYIDNLTKFQYPGKIIVFCYLYPSENEDKALDTIFNLNGYKKRPTRFKNMLNFIFKYLILKFKDIKFIQLDKVISCKDNSLYSGKLRLNEKGGDILTNSIIKEIFVN